jgi:hypothetical protein
MIEVKDLVLVKDIEEAKKISILGSNGELDVYVINQRTGLPHQLTIGDLDNIRAESPKQVVIELADFLHTYFQRVSFLDLRVQRLKYNEIFSKIEETLNLSSQLAASLYWTEFEKQVKAAVSAYPSWSKSYSTRGVKIKKEAIKVWLKDSGIDDRQAEIIKNILSDIFLKSDK